MLVSQIFVAPGNGGTAQGLDKVSNVSIAVESFSELVDFAEKMEVNLVIPGQCLYEHSFTILPYFEKHEAPSRGIGTVLSLCADSEVGPEIPLVKGVTDYFKKCTIQLAYHA